MDRNGDRRGGFGEGAGRAGAGILRVTLLFGSAAIAVALLATPYLDRETRLAQTERGRSLDMMSTGSVRGKAVQYTVGRSVLQATPQSVCIVHQDGRQSGDC